ncbi:hypothetical protein DPMN_010502 [Dreissena polymorpha]|uniref:Uncharacterized protein n=1 Tax=Dreissena polymorpha TaxID=45954 RepID=A0A9D4MYV8_DREPO|nr:hypothetical protein DPMN_010502 [Dreissena polymorpha]
MVEVLQLFPESPLNSIPLTQSITSSIWKGESKQHCLTPVLTSKASVSCLPLTMLQVISCLRLSDDADDLSWHTLVSQKSPEGLPVNAVEHIFIVNEVDIQRRIPLQGCFPE